MFSKNWRIPIVMGVAALFSTSYAGLAVAEEWEENTPYYEDDAWYDITEWFDGNDYNPTDEIAGVWDDEAHDSTAVDYDQDNDVPYGLYDNTADWYYDYDYDPYLNYYDLNLNDSVYDYAVGYYDYDEDGIYDSYTTYSDWDSDGVYEDVNYYNLADNSSQSGQGTQSGQGQTSTGQTNQQATQDQSTAQNQQKNRQARDRERQRSSQRVELSGTVKQTKEVQTLTGKHMVAQLSSDRGDIAVDLGSTEDAKQWNLAEGTDLTVQGAMAKVGDKQVVIAQQIQLGDGQQRQVDRNRANIEGKVASTKQVDVRGTTHQLAIVDLKDKDQKLMVDFGPAQGFDQELKEGDDITVKGVPIRVRDKIGLLANSAEVNGKKIEINRQKEKPQEVARARS